MKMQKAKRKLVALKLCIGGIAGSGKTMSSLLIAKGMIQESHPGIKEDEIWEKICLIDTENASGSLYVNQKVKGTTSTIGEYFTIEIEPPFTVDKYIEAIKTAEENGIEVLIIDSISHAWAGEGGALDKHENITATSRMGNSYTAWREPKKDQAKLMNTILQSHMHVIVCVRAKTEYVQEKDDRGKTTIKKVGLGLITQGETEYEYTTVFMLAENHIASCTKDRTTMFADTYFVPTPDTGKQFIKWLQSEPYEIPETKPVEEPVPEAPAPPAEPAEPVDKERVKKAVDAITATITALKEKGVDKAEISAIVEENCGIKNYMKVTDIDKLTNTYKALKKKEV